MNDILVSNLPIKPQENINIGMCIAPVVSELISKKIECKNILSINLLHSYERKNLVYDNYLNTLNDFYINYDNIFIDSNHICELNECVKQLYKKEIIVEKFGKVNRCECGKVDIVNSGIRNYNNGDLYYKFGENIYCKKCGKICKEYEEKQLYLYLNPEISDFVNITPNYFQAELSHFYKTMPGQYLLISKHRNTGAQLRTQTDTYNIDVDLLWMSYINCFKENKNILVASNHQLYEMYIMNYINKMNFGKQLYFIATPYMNKTKINLEQEIYKYDELYKKLCILYSLKWKNKNCNWDENIFRYVAKLGGGKRKLLYNNIIEEKYNDNLDLNMYINNFLLRKVNLQKNVKELKR